MRIEDIVGVVKNIVIYVALMFLCYGYAWCTLGSIVVIFGLLKHGIQAVIPLLVHFTTLCVVMIAYSSCKFIGKFLDRGDSNGALIFWGCVGLSTLIIEFLILFNI